MAMVLLTAVSGFGLIMILTLFVGERYFTVLHRSDERWGSDRHV